MRSDRKETRDDDILRRVQEHEPYTYIAAVHGISKQRVSQIVIRAMGTIDPVKAPRPWQHGTHYGYFVRKCRCGPCVTENKYQNRMHYLSAKERTR